MKERSTSRRKAFSMISYGTPLYCFNFLPANCFVVARKLYATTKDEFSFSFRSAVHSLVKETLSRCEPYAHKAGHETTRDADNEANLEATSPPKTAGLRCMLMSSLVSQMGP